MLSAPRSASRLLVDDTVLIVQPRLAAAIGKDEAMLLQQIHYWLCQSGHERDGQRWIYNSYAEWTIQFPFWNKDKVRRVVERLRRLGLVRTARYNRYAYDRTTWYTIDYAALVALGLPPPPPAPLDPPDPPAVDPPAAPPPARPATVPTVPTVPASVAGVPDVVCAGAAPGPTWHAEQRAESRGDDNKTRRFTAFNRTRQADGGGGAAAAPGGAAAPGRGAVATGGGTGATPCGGFAPGGGNGAPPIPETTAEITSETNQRERERDGAPPPPAFETLTMTEPLTGWLAAECAAQGVPLQGVDARYETDKWRDEIRAGRRAVPADAAADWRQWMRRALAYCRRHQPTGPTTHVPISLASGSTQSFGEDLAAREAKAADGFRARMDLLFGRTAAGSGGAGAVCPV